MKNYQTKIAKEAEEAAKKEASKINNKKKLKKEGADDDVKEEEEEKEEENLDKDYLELESTGRCFDQCTHSITFSIHFFNQIILNFYLLTFVSFL